MKNKNHKKLIVASALIAGATIGGAAITSNQMANATSSNNDQTESSELHERPELSEEEKAELKEKLDAMTDEERKEWLENHKPKGANPPELGERPDFSESGEHPELPNFENGEHPTDLSSEAPSEE